MSCVTFMTLNQLVPLTKKIHAVLQWRASLEAQATNWWQPTVQPPLYRCQVRALQFCLFNYIPFQLNIKKTPRNRPAKTTIYRGNMPCVIIIEFNCEALIIVVVFFLSQGSSRWDGKIILEQERWVRSCNHPFTEVLSSCFPFRHCGEFVSVWQKTGHH